MAQSTKIFQQRTKESHVKVNWCINNCLQKLAYCGQIHVFFNEFSYSRWFEITLYVLYCTGVCFLCSTFIASPHEYNPITTLSLDIRTELLVWRRLVKIVHNLKLFIEAQVLRLLTAGFLVRTEEKPGVCIKLKPRSKNCTTWHWTIIQEIKETVAF